MIEYKCVNGHDRCNQMLPCEECPYCERICESPVHDAFGLTYSSYFCVPRMVLEAMPIAWQHKFVALVEQLPDTPTYAVNLRDGRGRFVVDELRNYRRGRLPDEIQAQIDAKHKS
jgi:hypothetical protein